MEDHKYTPPSCDYFLAQRASLVRVCPRTVVVTETSPCFSTTDSVAHRGTSCLKRDSERNRHLHRSAPHTKDGFILQDAAATVGIPNFFGGLTVRQTVCRSCADDGKLGYVLVTSCQYLQRLGITERGYTKDTDEELPPHHCSSGGFVIDTYVRQFHWVHLATPA